MKAIVVRGPGDIVYTDVAKPKLRPGFILIKVKFCGICGTDLGIYTGDISFARDGLVEYPVRIGHEWSGIVEEIGEGVTKVKVGDRVSSGSFISCGECIACKEGRYSHCEKGQSIGTLKCWDGAFAEYMLMPSWNVCIIPDNVGIDEGALIEPATIAINALKLAETGPQSRVLVIGTGCIGLAAVGMARYMGASKVMLAGRKKNKLDVGIEMGAHAVVNLTEENMMDFVMRETAGKGANVVIEASGGIDCINQAIDVTTSRGIISLLGFYETELNKVKVDRLVGYGIQIKGTGSDDHLNEVVEMLASRKLSFKPLITHKFAYEDAIEAFKTAGEKSDKIKMLVEINKDI